LCIDKCKLQKSFIVFSGLKLCSSVGWWGKKGRRKSKVGYKTSKLGFRPSVFGSMSVSVSVLVGVWACINHKSWLGLVNL